MLSKIRIIHKQTHRCVEYLLVVWCLYIMRSVDIIIPLVLLLCMIGTDIIKFATKQNNERKRRRKRFTREEGGKVVVASEDMYEMIMYVYELENATME